MQPIRYEYESEHRNLADEVHFGISEQLHIPGWKDKRKNFYVFTRHFVVDPYFSSFNFLPITFLDGN